MSTYKAVITARSFGKTDGKAYDCLTAAGIGWVRLAENAAMEERMRELADADALIAGLEEIDDAQMAACPRLKVISRYGVGYDRVDVAAARKRGIAVTITPGANGDSVADLAVALMLDAARGVSRMDASIRAGHTSRVQGLEMYGKVLGVIGAGRIGKGVARRCRGFDMKILVNDVFEDEAFARETGAEYVELDRLLREADFISVHSPLTSETEGLIGRDAFAKMKESAVLVNTARGGIVDEEALLEALQANRIRAAALDATVHEPPQDSPLAQCENCILTPHAGAATEEASSRMSRMAAQNVIDILIEGTCRYQI